MLLNYFHYALEIMYEFFKGTRIIERETLDACEIKITDLMLDWQHAVDYYQEGKADDDKDEMREGVFQAFDSFLHLTDLS